MKLKIVCKLLAKNTGDGYRGYVSIRKTYHWCGFPKVIHFTLDHQSINDVLTLRMAPDSTDIYARLCPAHDATARTTLPPIDASWLRYGPHKNALLSVAYDAIRKALSLLNDSRSFQRVYDPMNEAVWSIIPTHYSAAHALNEALRRRGLP